METSNSKPVTFLLVDDHEMIRGGLRRLIEAENDWKVAGEAGNGRDAIKLATELQPDVIVLDVGMPDLNGVEATRMIKKASPQSEILIFSGIDSESLILDAFEAGARSYILKTDPHTELLTAIQALLRKKPYFTARIGEVVFARLMQKHPDAAHNDLPEKGRLTQREREIVQLLAEGFSNKEVAEHLGISVKTAESHRAAIMKKLGFENFADLVRYAIRNHIIEP